MADSEVNDPSLERRIRGLWQHPEVWLAFGTLWLYWVASCYVQGYLRHFLAHADWFSPSVFALVSFAGDAVLLATFAVFVVVLLARFSATQSRWWYLAYAGWLGLLAAVGVPYAGAVIDEYRMVRWDLFVMPLITLLLWTVSPLLWRYRDSRWTRLVGQAEALRVELEAARTRGEPAAVIDDLDRRSSRARDAALTPWFRFSHRYGPTAALFNMGFLFLFVVHGQGFARAHREFRAAKTALSAFAAPSTPEQPKAWAAIREAQLYRILFTDGTAVLGVTTRQGTAMPYFRTGNGEEIVLCTLGDMGAVAEQAHSDLKKALEDLDRLKTDLDKAKPPETRPTSP